MPHRTVLDVRNYFIVPGLTFLLIASPLAWLLLNNFLQRYPIRITIPWWVFPSTGIVALVFAIMIVSTQAFRAARANPVNSLRNE